MSTHRAEMKSASFSPTLRLRIVLEDEIAVGPGKADLLEGIRETGSIAAAGRRLGMSYKRAWLLVDTMNGCFSKPVVEAAKGGKSGGGAWLTAVGDEVLDRYRHMESETERIVAGDLARLKQLMRNKAPK